MGKGHEGLGVNLVFLILVVILLLVGQIVDAEVVAGGASHAELQILHIILHLMTIVSGSRCLLVSVLGGELVGVVVVERGGRGGGIDVDSAGASGA